MQRRAPQASAGRAWKPNHHEASGCRVAQGHITHVHVGVLRRHGISAHRTHRDRSTALEGDACLCSSSRSSSNTPPLMTMGFLPSTQDRLTSWSRRRALWLRRTRRAQRLPRPRRARLSRSVSGLTIRTPERRISPTRFPAFTLDVVLANYTLCGASAWPWGRRGCLPWGACSCPSTCAQTGRYSSGCPWQCQGERRARPHHILDGEPGRRVCTPCTHCMAQVTVWFLTPPRRSRAVSGSRRDRPQSSGRQRRELRGRHPRPPQSSHQNSTPTSTATGLSLRRWP